MGEVRETGLHPARLELEREGRLSIPSNPDLSCQRVTSGKRLGKSADS